MSRILRGTVVLLAGAWLAAHADAIPAGGAQDSLYEQAVRLTHENACLHAETELVEGGRFYLVLDTEQRSLRLKLRGALLREVPLDSIKIGRPYRLFFERDTPSQIRGRLHRYTRLTPRRPLLRLPVEIREGSEDETQTIMLPPEPEAAIAVPRRFFVRFESGLALEFGTQEGRRDWGQRIADGFSALFGTPELRVRLVLDRAAAEMFYRSLPRETDLLVL